MRAIDASSVGEALSVSVRAGVPVLLWGSPGTGKTSVVRALGEALGWPTEVVIGSIREPADFAGLPIVVDGAVQMAPPLWARRLAAAEQGLLFLDELTTAPPAVQAAMLRVVLERVVGDLVLPDGIRVVAAANPPEEAAEGWELSPPLANRLVHLDWPVDAKAVSQGLVMGFAAPRPFDGASPTDAQALAGRAAVGAFLQVRPTLVLDVPSAAGQASRGWPSPRSWESVARLVAMCEAVGASEDARTLLVLGAVGEGAGIEFLSWLANMDLPDPEQVLADPDGFDLPERSDRAFAVLTAVAAVAIAHGDAASWSAAWRVVARVADRAPDVAALAARALAGARPAGAELPAGLLQMAPVLRAAGLMRTEGHGDPRPD
ncbi:MAG TPA: ATP-binding protein [Acidimicrobiales bacterium]|nr:ATP-binding protein [Acidimicrobiales bacterium]